jgi:hypothetical protein
MIPMPYRCVTSVFKKQKAHIRPLKGIYTKNALKIPKNTYVWNRIKRQEPGIKIKVL